MAGGHGSDGDGNFYVHGCVILRERWISVLWDLLKFAKCPYWCLITALYGSSGKIIRGVIVFRRVPVSYSDYPLVFRGVSVMLTPGTNFL